MLDLLNECYSVKELEYAFAGAMAVRHLGALGAYRAPSESKQLATFVAVVAVTSVAP